MSKMAEVYLGLIETLTDDPKMQDYLLDHCDEFCEKISPEAVEYLAKGGNLNKKDESP